MPRELWKGAIQFGLVHIPVCLFPAEQSEELSFTMLDRRDLQPVGYKRFNKTTGDEVPYEQIVKGYEWSEGEYVTLEKEDFKRANVEASQTVDIAGFVERESLPPYFFESPYYLAPGKHGEKGYALLRDPKELKVPEDLKAAKVNPRELDMAGRLVEDMAMDFDPGKFHDTYRDDLMKLIEQKASGKLKPEPRSKRAPREAQVIDFASLLEKSLGSRKRPEGPSRGAANDEHHTRRKAPAARARRKGAPKSGTSHRRAA